MRLIRKRVAGAVLLALAGCTGNGGDTGVRQSIGGNPAPSDEIDRLADSLRDGTLAAAGIGDTVYFDYDKTSLRPDSLPALSHIAEWMQRHPNAQIRIAGHADERGTREYNLALGDRRAAAVRAYLVSIGIPARRLETMSYGKERPVAVGSSEEFWAKNRRAVAEIE